MPVEIREVVIRAVATVEREDTQDGTGASGSGSALGPMDSREAIIQECVRQVLRILRKEKER